MITEVLSSEGVSLLSAGDIEEFVVFFYQALYTKDN